jgi:hypothetical protein
MQVARVSPLLFISRCRSCDAIAFVESELEAMNLNHRCLQNLEREVHLVDRIESAVGFMAIDFDFPPPELWN